MAKRPVAFDDVANEFAEDLPGGDLSGTAISAVKVKKASEDFALAGDISPAQITANQNDYNPTGLSTANVLRLTTDASRDVTGLQGGADGRILVVLNRGSYNLVLKHESASSTAANRFKFPMVGDHTLVPGAGITLIYDSIDSRWLPLCMTGSSTFSVWDPDIPPMSPSAHDDEFDGTSGVSWTDVNWSGLTAWDANTTYPGWLWAKNPTGTEVLRCKLQALPAGDFCIVGKMNASGGAGTVVAGLVLSTTNTASSGTQFTAAIARRSSAFAYGSQKYTNFTTFGSDLVNIGSAHPNGTIWLRLRLSGSTYYAGFSIDGKTWYEQTISPGVTPSYMGIFVDNAASGQNQEVSFDYFRYSSSASATFGGVRTYNSTTVPGTVAPYDAQYLVLAANSTLTNERVATAGQGITFTDAGAGSTFTIAFNGAFGTTRGNMTATSASTTAGDFWNDSTQKAMSHYFNAVQQQLTGVIFTQTADATCANTTSETSILGTGIGTKTLPANFLVAGKTVRLTLRAYYTTTAFPTLDIKFKVGGTSVASTGAVTFSSTIGSLVVSVDWTCRTTGVSGTSFIQGYTVRFASSGTGYSEMKNTATTTINTTTTQAIDVTATWGTASASNSITSTNATIEILN